MRSKFLLNILYTIGLAISVITLIWGFQQSHYEFVAAGVLVGAMFAVLKIKLLKEVRRTIKDRKP